jgi:hypothetical protein
MVVRALIPGRGDCRADASCKGELHEYERAAILLFHFHRNYGLRLVACDTPLERSFRRRRRVSPTGTHD